MTYGLFVNLMFAEKISTVDLVGVTFRCKQTKFIKYAVADMSTIGSDSFKCTPILLF